MGPSSGDCNPTLNEIQLLRWVLLVELWPKLRCKSSYKWALVASPPKLQSTSSHKLNLEGSLQLASTGAHSFITLHASSPLASTFDLINVRISIRSSCILKIVLKEKCKIREKIDSLNFGISIQLQDIEASVTRVLFQFFDIKILANVSKKLAKFFNL